jgi:DNA helicase-2/ATP-dependent DNA helicase PcrA
MTRARERLSLSCAASRFLGGEAGFTQPSRFLAELPPEHMESCDLADAYGAEPRAVRAGRGYGSRRGWSRPESDDDLALDDDDGFEVHDAPAPADEEERAVVETSAAPSLRPGDLVQHAEHGRGKVLSISRHKAVVQFFAGGIRLLALDDGSLGRA